jgi:hypothetical protein
MVERREGGRWEHEQMFATLTGGQGAPCGRPQIARQYTRRTPEDGSTLPRRSPVSR